MGFFSSLSRIVETAQQGGSSATIGIDVGASSIKVVEVADENNVLTLRTYGEVQLGPYAEKPVGSTVKLTPQQEQAALVDVLRESAVTSRNAVFAMPLAASFISTFDLKADHDSDLSAVVRVEARKLIPVSLNEVTLDWAELESDSDNERTVLIAAIQNTAIGRFNTLQQFAGFADAPTEIECFSANRAIGQQQNSLVIDFGAATTKMYLSRNGALSRVFRFNVGGKDLTTTIAKELEINFEEAEALKLSSDQEEKQEVISRLCRKQYQHPVNEFKQALDAYHKKSGTNYNLVQLCGGASMDAEVVSLVEDVFDLPVEHMSPFDNLAYPAFMEDTMKEIGPGFVPAIGAALRSF